MRDYSNYKSKGKKTVIFTIAILFLIYLALPALAQTIQELEKQKQDAEQRLKLAQYQVDQNQKTIDGIEQEIINSNKIIETYDNEIKNLNRDITNINNQIVQTQAQLDEATKQEQEQSETLNERLRVQYMYGNDGYAEALFDGDSITQQVENSEIIADILQADEDLLDKYTQNKLNIAQAKATLENQRAELNSKKAQLDENLKRQNELRDQQQLLLDNNVALINQGKEQIRKEEAAIAEANTKIIELTRESDKETINKTVDNVNEVIDTASSYLNSIENSLTTIQTILDQTSSNEVSDLKDQVQKIVDTSNSQYQQLKEILDNTKDANSAADAIEKSKNCENLLQVISNNDVSVKELLVKAKDIQLQITQEKEKQAQEELERQQTEEAQRQAEEAQRKAEEAQKEKEQLEKELENANNENEEIKETVEEEIEEAPQETVTRDSWTEDFISTTGWRWPLDNVYYITSLFGYRIHPIFGTGRGHEGVDIGASSGTPIHACDGGTVISAGYNGGYGKCVIIQQDSGHQVYYAHQSEIGVSEGQRVEKGDVIGYVGSTGWSTGPHLHLGVLSGGSFVDPFNFFPEME